MDRSSKYTLRWRGRQLGPYTVNEIEHKLAQREIGMLHEVFWNGQWMSIQEASREWPKTNQNSTIALNTQEQQESPSQSHSNTNQSAFQIRWQGRALGAMSVAEIERHLDQQDFGMLHEIQMNGEWMTLNDFFVGRNFIEARRQTQIKASEPVRQKSSKRGARMALLEVGRTIGRGNRILHDINLIIEPNEFVALLGPSGSGKSTLMNAMTARQPATEGKITLNDDDLYKHLWKYRQQIGHVPQKDIVHMPLTVQQEMTFAGRLRLPASLPFAAVRDRVETVIEQIGLQERGQIRNANLSGGQLKRVSLGVELLSDPQLLFLDEATSGLDAGIEARMMSLFRRLADERRTVVCVTHNLDNVCLCDLVAVLVGGRLAFYGPPLELPAYFQVEKLAAVYDRLGDVSPEEWAQKFKASPHYNKYVTARQSMSLTNNQNAPATMLSRPNGAVHQFIILTHRYISVAFQDYKNIVILLIQAPIIALLIGLVFHNENFENLPGGPLNQKMLSFLLVISAIWFGCINSAREIVKEQPLFLREQAIGLNIISYLGSKIAVLGFFCALQCVALLSITLSATQFRPNAGIQLCCLLLTSLAGMMMGLLISALMKSEDKAVAFVPILLIPQVVFAGAILKLSGLAEAIAKGLVVSYWSLDAMLHALPESARETLPPACRLRYDLAFMALFLCVLMVATVVILKRKETFK